MRTRYAHIAVVVVVAVVAAGAATCSGDEYDSGCPSWVGAEHYLACPGSTRAKCSEESIRFQGQIHLAVHAWCQTKSGAQRHGPYRARYDNGTEAEEGWYCSGTACGVRYEWWPDGNLASQFPACQSLGGSACGLSKSWHENGVQAHRASFRFASGLSVICDTETEWDDQGAVVSETEHAPCSDFEVCPETCSCDCQ